MAKRQRERYRPRSRAQIGGAIKSFVGYLEGSGKAAHTIRSYRSDLLSFQRYLESGLGARRVLLDELSLADFQAYQEYLASEGFKTNTRRRKVLTVRKLIRFLTQRKKIALDASNRIPAPHKIERLPSTLNYEGLLARIHEMPDASTLEARNRVLLWTMLETGCQVSEICRIRYKDWQPGALLIDGKNARELQVSQELCQAVSLLKRKSLASKEFLFIGFNKFGPLGLPITPRGVEVLLHSLARSLYTPGPALDSEVRLTPRTIRHSTVMHWYGLGIDRAEIQRRLGLKSSYAFRTYDSLFRSSRNSDPAVKPHPLVE